VRASAQPAEIPARSFVQKVLIHLDAKNGIEEIELADLRAL
jgi:hypothetical protein